MLVSVGVQSPTEIKASGGWQRCADEDVALLCDAHLADKYAEAYLNIRGVSMKFIGRKTELAKMNTEYAFLVK